MRTVLTVTLVSACVALGAVPADAQALKITPRVGMYVPASDLGELGGESISLDNSLALGLGIEFGVPFLPINLRANIDYATDTPITGDDTQQIDRTTVLAVVGDAVFRFRRGFGLQPYLFAGGGLKQYDFDTDNTDVGAFRDASDPTLHLGGGLDIGLRGLSLNVELGDYISQLELADGSSQTQHDLFLTVGLAIGLF